MHFGTVNTAQSQECRQLFNKIPVLSDLLKSQNEIAKLVRPEISKKYESELEQILLEDDFTELHFLRKGVGITYLTVLKNSNLKVIAKRYVPLKELEVAYVNSHSQEYEKEAKEHYSSAQQSIKNEFLAWNVSSKLGLDVFPFGVIRIIDGEYWWVQLYLEGTYTFADSNLRRGRSKEKVAEFMSEIQQSKWALRDSMLNYLLADVDHPGNSLYDLKEKRQFYIDAGSAFAIVLSNEVRLSREIKKVYPFMFNRDRLTATQVKADVDFFKYFVNVDVRLILPLMKQSGLEDGRIVDFELRLAKLQSQVRQLLK